MDGVIDTNNPPSYVIFTRLFGDKTSVTAVLPNKSSEELEIPNGLLKFLKLLKCKDVDDVLGRILEYRRIAWETATGRIQILPQDIGENSSFELPRIVAVPKVYSRII